MRHVGAAVVAKVAHQSGFEDEFGELLLDDVDGSEVTSSIHPGPKATRALAYRQRLVEERTDLGDRLCEEINGRWGKVLHRRASL
jgi:hypothetical protein